MRKGLLVICLLTCIMFTVSGVMLCPNTLPVFGAVQSLDVGSKIVYGPFYNLSSSNPIQIPIPTGWNVNSINMSFFNIIAPNSTVSMEEDVFKANDIAVYVRAMSFQLPENQTAYLYSISLYLLHFPFDMPLMPLNLNLSLFNATSTTINGKTIPKPDTLLNSKTVPFPVATGPIGWKDFFSDTSYKLNPEVGTYNRTYFITLTNATAFPGIYRVFWFYAPDNGSATDGDEYEDKGYAFYYNSALGDWELEYIDDSSTTLDYCLRVRFSVNNETGAWETPFPTHVNMNVNGSIVTDLLERGFGLCNLSQSLNISRNLANLYIGTSWFSPLRFSVSIEVYGVDVLGMLYLQGLTIFLFYSSMKGDGDRFLMLMSLVATGAVVLAGYGGQRTYKKRRIPLNAMRSLENILVDHKAAGTLIWSFDFISMQQDIALVSGFIQAIKTFLEEMKVGGLKRLGTEFGTFIREESKLLTATCIAGNIGIDEELWIRNKLHEFLIQGEQKHYKKLEEWKGDVGQFRESFPFILSSLIDLKKVQSLQRQKIEKLTRDKDKLQREVDKYGAKLDKLKGRYDAGEIGFKNYLVERYKIEAKYDKVQKDYLYASLFLSRAAPILEEKPLKPKEIEMLEKIQNRFLEIRKEIDELRKKELKGIITSEDIAVKEKLQKELMNLMEKLEKLKK
ncbi:MAG: hypothetical protein Q6367_003350 [Candidatus Freyarchaeota archaeon]